MLHCYTVWATYTGKRMAYQNNIKTDVETNMDRQAVLIMLGYTKAGEFLRYLSSYQLLRTVSTTVTSEMISEMRHMDMSEALL